MSEVFTDGLPDEPHLRKSIEEYLKKGEEPMKVTVVFKKVSHKRTLYERIKEALKPCPQ
jgi:hypothetical protein